MSDPNYDENFEIGLIPQLFRMQVDGRTLEVKATGGGWTVTVNDYQGPALFLYAAQWNRAGYTTKFASATRAGRAAKAAPRPDDWRQVR